MKKQTKDILNALPITGQKLIHDAYIEIESKLRNAGIISLADKMTAYKLLSIKNKNDKPKYSVEDVINIMREE